MIAGKRPLVWLALAAILGSAIVFSLLPTSDKDAIWTHNVLRNWEDQGYFRLGGKLVYNPGGIDALAHPDIYTGHRAASLVPAFICYHLFGGKSNLPFFALLAAVVAVATATLFKERRLGCVLGLLVVFSPGYTRLAPVIDPLAVPTVLGILVIGCAAHILRKEKIGLASGLALALIVIPFCALNWTTIFPISIGMVWLWISLRGAFRRWALFAVLAGAGTAVVGVVSVLDKISGGAQPLGVRIESLYQSYLYGPGGYGGYAMNWTRALVRLAGANLIGLFPVICVFGWSLWRARRQPPTSLLRAVAPLLAAILSVVGMRNYFAHHPWMAAPVLLVGFVFSIQLLSNCAPISESQKVENGLKGNVLVVSAVAGALVYSFLILLILRVNSADEDALIEMVRKNTRRHDRIAVVRQTDSWLASNTNRLEASLDRRMMVIESIEGFPNPGLGDTAKVYHLTTFAGNQAWAARTERIEIPLQSTLARVLGWYRRRIARRSEGDRLDLKSVYYLYPMPGNSAKTGNQGE